MTVASTTDQRTQIGAYVASVADTAAARFPDYVSIIWKGSTHKPWEGPFDFLPGLSDIDIHVYRAEPLAEPWQLRREIFAAAGPAPFDTPLQLLVLDAATLPDWWTILPGTYEVLHGGEPPTKVPPTSRLLDRDRFGLAGAAADAARVASDVVGLPDDELWPYLRSARSLFPPVLFRAVSVWTGRPERVWSLNRSQLLALAREHQSLAQLTDAAVDYFMSALRACQTGGDAESSEEALRAGHRLLSNAAEWAAERPVTDRRMAGPPL